jgi:adenine-specific DNA methylase
VGFGDISGNNTTERILSAFFMMTGVIGFSFGSGSLASIMNDIDYQTARLN